MNLVEKPGGVRPLGPVDVTDLQALVARISDTAWELEDGRKENNFDCFHHTRHIVFRFIEGNIDPERYYSTEAWPIWRRWLEPVMQAAVVPYGFRKPAFPKAMFARLQAGQRIDRHTDGAGSNLRTHKIHVPLVTNPDAVLIVGDQAYHLEVGQAYEVNNIIAHGGFNGGAVDRIHFIFEVFESAEAAVAN